ncbi:MAG TPA: double zinc ribbon domain-containing protein [Gemmatimonadales bacterium]
MPRFAPRWPELRGLAGAMERWLLPGECLLCHRHNSPGEQDPLVCAACRQRWSPLPHPQCPRCGQPEMPGIACRVCAGWPEALTGVRSAVWLDPPARKAVHRFKYDGWWRVAEAMAERMRALVPPGSRAALVPIPLGASRQRKRGYNQSAVLAEFLGRMSGVPVAAAALRRRRDTATQTALTPEERRANLSGAFVATGTPPLRPLLVDDVFTTGATLAEAALALQAAGAREIGGITFARAARPLADAVAVPTHRPATTHGSRA